jgi:hypothetical protein
MSFEFTCSFGCSSNNLLIVEYISYWESCDYYDFVVVKVVSELMRIIAS